MRTGGRLENLTRHRRCCRQHARRAYRFASATSPSVAIGGEIRTGSASENGHEVVVGTALMLIGSNSRTVAAAVDAKIDEIRRTLPPGIELKTVLNRTQLVDATIDDRRHQSRRRRAAGDPRAVRDARQFPRGAHHRAGHPARHADDGSRHVAGAASAPT